MERENRKIGTDNDHAVFKYCMLYTLYSRVDILLNTLVKMQLKHFLFEHLKIMHDE